MENRKRRSNSGTDTSLAREIQEIRPSIKENDDDERVDAGKQMEKGDSLALKCEEDK